MCVLVNVRCVWVAFVCCCFACDCVLELVVCRVRFARVSCPWLRFGSARTVLKPGVGRHLTNVSPYRNARRGLRT